MSIQVLFSSIGNHTKALEDIKLRENKLVTKHKYYESVLYKTPKLVKFTEESVE